MRLKDKVAVITGGGRGIGRALALGFAREGAHLVLAARTTAEVESAAEEVHALSRQALAVTCDVSDEDQAKALVASALAHFGRVDILINNAAVGYARPVHGIPLASWERTLAVNLTGTFLCTKHVWKPMQRAGGGAILNVSSLGGQRGYPMLAAYCASKFGQIGLTLAAAEEGKAANIRVNAIAPGKADTAFRAAVREDKSRMLTADDHVGLCVFLVSDEARFITGQVVAIEWFGEPAAAGPE